MFSEAEEWAELEVLEDTLRQLTLAALKLPAGADRRDSLVMIGSFRDRLASIKEAELNRCEHHADPAENRADSSCLSVRFKYVANVKESYAAVILTMRLGAPFWFLVS